MSVEPQVADWAIGLARRLAALPDVRMREAVLLDYVQRTAAGDAAAVLDQIRCRGGHGGPPFSVALLALAHLLDGDRLEYAQLAELYRAAKERELEGLTRLLLSGLPAQRSEVSDAGPERELTLGHRKTLARSGSGEALQRLLRRPEPEVLPHLLQNPRVVERDVVRLAARRPTEPALQRVILRSGRWGARHAVKRALVLNPYTPTELSLRLLGFLARSDLQLVAETATLATDLREAAAQLLGRR
ncbi:MAG: hypothetical protein IPG96_18915 [Proteobacteria bacterium]|nr:hypothetical protein [Pseudomonadota bacterium]